jgi:ABC-type transport system involved in cytochrome bd biosynthesis fused ATPase/permease subunit
VELGPRWLATRRAGELATLSTTGVDALDAYFAKYLPQVVLAVVVPLAVVARLLAADPGRRLARARVRDRRIRPDVA